VVFFCFSLIVVVGFLRVRFFMGFAVDCFLLLGCCLRFVWLLLWLWERFSK